DALAGVLAQLEGYEAAAGAWETELLPARIDDYSIAWLDDLCRAGRIGWQRLRPGSGGSGGPLRSTPIVLMPRRHMAFWTSIINGHDKPSMISSRAQAVFDTLRQQGALFFDELLHDTGLLRTELENALGELVAAGRITADSFAGLRALLMPAAKREHPRHRRLRRHLLNGIEDAGRWSLLRHAANPQPAEQHAIVRDHAAEPEALEHIARSLLRRYGVVFWKLLEREAAWLPSWRQLLRVYQRLEARGEIRGGRFVEGLVGEQFALPEAIGRLRAIRQAPLDEQLVCLSGSDPLNLVGTVLVGQRLPAISSTRVLYQDGIPVAALVANQPQWLLEPDATQRPRWQQALQRREGGARNPHSVSAPT
ncbi:MAG: ATP-dependent DNA helicase, partial [Dyella sp.]